MSTLVRATFVSPIWDGRFGARVAKTPRFGAPGAAVATFLGYCVSAVLTYRVAQRVHPLPYRGGRLVLVFVTALGLGLLAQQAPPASGPGMTAKIAAALAFVALCAGLGIWKERGAVAPSVAGAERAGRP